MALDFGMNNVFSTSAGDVAGIHQIILKGSRFEESIDFLPKLTDGEIVLWTPPGDIYDVYNSVVDFTKWGLYNTPLNVAASETTDYIQILGTGTGGAGISVIFQADDLPARTTYSNMKFRLTRNITKPSANSKTRVNLYLFGTEIDIFAEQPTGTYDEDDIFEFRKKSNDDWEVWKNEGYVMDVTPTNSVFYIDMFSSGGETATHTAYARFYTVTIDGSTFLLIGANGETYRTPMNKI